MNLHGTGMFGKDSHLRIHSLKTQSCTVLHCRLALMVRGTLNSATITAKRWRNVFYVFLNAALLLTCMLHVPAVVSSKFSATLASVFVKSSQTAGTDKRLNISANYINVQIYRGCTNVNVTCEWNMLAACVASLATATN